MTTKNARRIKICGELGAGLAGKIAERKLESAMLAEEKLQKERLRVQRRQEGSTSQVRKMSAIYPLPPLPH